MRMKNAPKRTTKHHCPQKLPRRWISKPDAIATLARCFPARSKLVVCAFMTFGQIAEAVQGYRAASNAYMRKPVSSAAIIHYYAVDAPFGAPSSSSLIFSPLSRPLCRTTTMRAQCCPRPPSSWRTLTGAQRATCSSPRWTS